MGLLAHQGGWDEILMVVAPILVIGGLILLVQRRAEAARIAPDDTDAQSSTSSIDAPRDDNRPTKSS